MLQGSSGTIQLHYFDRNHLKLEETESASIKKVEHQKHMKKDTDKLLNASIELGCMNI